MFNYNCDVYFVTCARDGSVHICGGLQKKIILNFMYKTIRKMKIIQNVQGVTVGIRAYYCDSADYINMKGMTNR